MMLMMLMVCAIIAEAAKKASGERQVGDEYGNAGVVGGRYHPLPYAHFYSGLYLEACGDLVSAESCFAAAASSPSSDYMGLLMPMHLARCREAIALESRSTT